MLEVDYSTQFGELISSVGFDIELPEEWSQYFDERGEIPSYSRDERSNKRLKVRIHGLIWFDRPLPFRSRGDDAMGIYTRDFSRHGCGFLTPVQLYPSELVRLVLPTFWVRVEVVRARRITSRCYEIGTTIIQRHDPSEEAFAPAGQPETAMS